MLLKSFRKKRPQISVVVVIYNMQREAPRTLFSLSVPYQQGVRADDYEVIVVDNGSTEPLSADLVASFGPHFRYFFFPTTSKSPATAINFGVSQAKGDIVGIMIDGARIVTPGIINYSLLAARIYPQPVISTAGWHLGPDLQSRSISQGYNQAVEDKLLDDSKWQDNGYKLFEISALAGSSCDGFFRQIAESNCIFLRKEMFNTLGGMDERFESPGGGLVNLDFYKRAGEMAGASFIIILGEGSFHQLHGGVTTNVPLEQKSSKWDILEKEYLEIKKGGFSFPVIPLVYFGHTPPEVLRWIQFSAEKAIEKGLL